MKLLKHSPGLAVLFVLLGFGAALSIQGSSSGTLSFQSVALAADETKGRAVVEEGDRFGSIAEEDDKEPFAAEQQVVSDPFESINRTTHAFNDKFYFWLLKPVATVYATIIPEGFRVCIRNAFKNAEYPVRFVNCTLQGKFKGAGVETGRFLINSTLGMGGFFELASRDFDLYPYEEDTGQTLGFYGIPAGPHVHLPVLGPSSLRDVFGTAADVFLNPTYYVTPDMWVSGGLKAGKITNSASLRLGEYEDFKASALDPYVSMRDAYFQHRADQVKK